MCLIIGLLLIKLDFVFLLQSIIYRLFILWIQEEGRPFFAITSMMYLKGHPFAALRFYFLFLIRIHPVPRVLVGERAGDDGHDGKCNDDVEFLHRGTSRLIVDDGARLI